MRLAFHFTIISLSRTMDSNRCRWTTSIFQTVSGTVNIQSDKVSNERMFFLSQVLVTTEPLEASEQSVLIAVVFHQMALAPLYVNVVVILTTANEKKAIAWRVLAVKILHRRCRGNSLHFDHETKFDVYIDDPRFAAHQPNTCKWIKNLKITEVQSAVSIFSINWKNVFWTWFQSHERTIVKKRNTF